MWRARIQLTTDGHKPYLEAVEGDFGGAIDYAMLIKHYGEPTGALGRYSPGECIGTEQRRVEGRPDPKHAQHVMGVERQNLTMRMQMRRFTRLTNAFSKKAENHYFMVCLYTVAWFNFVKMMHRTLHWSPGYVRRPGGSALGHDGHIVGADRRDRSGSEAPRALQDEGPDRGGAGGKFKLTHYPPGTSYGIHEGCA